MDSSARLNASAADILEMEWIGELARREKDIVGPLGEWLRSGDLGYTDIPPGLRNDIFFKDIHSGEVHPCSLWESWGYGADEMENVRWQDYIHPDDREAVQKAFHEHRYGSHVLVGQSIFRVRDSRGRYHWILSSSAALRRTSDGVLYRYVGRDVDIDSRIKQERGLQRRIDDAQDHLARDRALMEAAGRIAGSADEDGLVDAVESAARGILGLKGFRLLLSQSSGVRNAAGPSLPDGADSDNWKLDGSGGTGRGGWLAWDIGAVNDGSVWMAFESSALRDGDSEGMIHTLGPIILSAWERIRYIEVLKLHATTDPLTGAWNRRAFLQQAGQSLRKRVEEGRTCAVVILDIDLFKAINDQFGHPFGDTVLKEVSDRMNGALRAGDLMCRWGGEEFALFLDDLDPTETKRVVDRIRRTAGNEKGEFGCPVTLSAGVQIVRSEEPRTLESALSHADEALLHAKSDGRNLVRLFENP